MVKDSTVLAVIPARGGSESIPLKNIKAFAGYPLLSYSIAAGLQSKLVDRVIVSTDDEQIAEVAGEYGAEVPFLRPEALAFNDTPDLPVFQHALGWLKEAESYSPDLVVQLRPTSPVRPPDCVDQAIAILRQNPEADSVRGVVPSGQNPFKMWTIREDGAMEPLLNSDFEEPYNMPRQHLPATYWQTGHIDVIRTETILNKNSMSGETILPLILAPRYAIDIDTEQDWMRAEWLVQHQAMEMVTPGRKMRPFPERVDLVILDFDGVLTDNRVWVDKDGRELIAANRSDGWGIARLKEMGVEVVILSTETDPVVTARAKKLSIEVTQGISDKPATLEQIIKDRDIQLDHSVYVGNDLNDLGCFPLVGYAFAVRDAHSEVLKAADYVLASKGGYGAVREVCDMLQSQSNLRGE